MDVNSGGSGGSADHRIRQISGSRGLGGSGGSGGSEGSGRSAGLGRSTGSEGLGRSGGSELRRPSSSRSEGIARSKSDLGNLFRG